MFAAHHAPFFKPTSASSPLDNVLTTERSHPKTVGLSQLAQNDLGKAIQILKAVDMAALQRILSYEEKIKALQKDMMAALSKGQKIFISGCGAAGRAALLVATQFANAYPHLSKQVVPLIAGGSASAVRAAEDFEDSKEYGVRQLLAQGWQAEDLLITLSASGSANFIHAQLEHAATHGKAKPYFFYCNSDQEVAISFAQKPIFADQHLRDRINFVSINVGPMALAGSTRMQAATAQILAIGIPLLDSANSLQTDTFTSNWSVAIHSLLTQLKDTDFQQLVPFIRAEATAYTANEYLYYHVDPAIALNTLTDTTERSPTFNLNYFENDNDEKKSECASLCRVIVKNTNTPEEGWKKIVGPYFTLLNWENVPHTTSKHTLGYDISEAVVKKRATYLAHKHHDFAISFLEDNLAFHLKDEHANFKLSRLEQLPKHLKNLMQQVVIKLMLNTHSTLVMGRLGFYYSNLMIFVKPSNMKLIDRGIRLAHELLTQGVCDQHLTLPPLIKEITRNKDLNALLLSIITSQFRQKMKTLKSSKSIVLETEHAVAQSLLEPLAWQYVGDVLVKNANKLAYKLR